MAAGEPAFAGRVAATIEGMRPARGRTLGEVVAGQLERLLSLGVAPAQAAAQLRAVLPLLSVGALDRPAAPPFDGLSFINANGLPFQWVLHLSSRGQGLGFLCEVGRPGTSCAVRLTQTLHRIGAACGLLGWSTPPFLDEAAAILLPGPADSWPTHWRSAAWVGVAAGGRGLVLKPYFNLNRDACRDRWLRVGWLLKALGRDSALARLCELSSACSAGSWPVGLALDLKPDGAVGRVKIYFRSEPTTLAWLERWQATAGEPAGVPIMRRFLDLFGPTDRGVFPDGAMVVSLEIHADEQLSFKTDLAVTKWGPSDAALLDAVAAFLGSDSAGTALARTAQALGLGDGGGRETALLRFVGLGFEPDGGSHLNVYIEPPLDDVQLAVDPARAGQIRVSDIAEKAVRRGIAALVDALADRHWEDFALPVGRSDAWVTAYILAMLADLSDSMRTEFGPRLDAALDWLLERRRPDGGWGYNAGVPDDADSTAWAVIALRGWQRGVAEAALRFLGECRSGEGFATYPRATSPAAAWATAAPDVEAVARTALGLAPNPAVLAADKGIAPAFWWTSPLYTTAMALAGTPRPLPAALRRQIAQAVPAGAFERALWLRAGVQAGLDVEICARRLVGEQGLDGLWTGAARLRLAHDLPGEPWRRIDSGTLYTDTSGLFTTATAVASLAQLCNP